MFVSASKVVSNTPRSTARKQIMGAERHCCALQQSSERSVEKTGRELEHAFLRILSPPRFRTMHGLATCGDRLVPDEDLVVSSTFHDVASPTKAPDARARKRSETKVGGGPGWSEPEQQPPCHGGLLAAAADLELGGVEHHQDTEYRNDMEHGTSDGVQYVGRSS
jgi:hypothetical protein